MTWHKSLGGMMLGLLTTTPSVVGAHSPARCDTGALQRALGLVQGDIYHTKEILVQYDMVFRDPHTPPVRRSEVAREIARLTQHYNEIRTQARSLAAQIQRCQPLNTSWRPVPRF